MFLFFKLGFQFPGVYTNLFIYFSCGIYNLSDTVLIYLYIYFWLHWVFNAVHGLSLVAVRGPLLMGASLVAEHGL